MVVIKRFFLIFILLVNTTFADEKRAPHGDYGITFSYLNDYGKEYDVRYSLFAFDVLSYKLGFRSFKPMKFYLAPSDSFLFEGGIPIISDDLFLNLGLEMTRYRLVESASKDTYGVVSLDYVHWYNIYPRFSYAVSTKYSNTYNIDGVIGFRFGLLWLGFGYSKRVKSGVGDDMFVFRVGLGASERY